MLTFYCIEGRSLSTSRSKVPAVRIVFHIPCLHVGKLKMVQRYFLVWRGKMAGKDLTVA